jgi:hypothetical protein
MKPRSRTNPPSSINRSITAPSFPLRLSKLTHYRAGKVVAVGGGEHAQVMVPPTRIERATRGLGNRCSIQLSYGGVLEYCTLRARPSTRPTPMYPYPYPARDVLDGEHRVAKMLHDPHRTMRRNFEPICLSSVTGSSRIKTATERAAET